MVFPCETSFPACVQAHSTVYDPLEREMGLILLSASERELNTNKPLGLPFPVSLTFCSPLGCTQS